MMTVRYFVLVNGGESMTRKTHLRLNFLICLCILMILVVITVSERILNNELSTFQNIWEGLVLIQLISEIMIITVIKNNLKKSKE